MQSCINCGFENPAGEIFCQRCGVALSAVSVNTSKLGEMEDDLAAGGGYMSEDHVVFLHLSGHPDPIALQLDHEIIMGRESGGGRLNLERFDAVEHGVSRQHATLFAIHSQVYLRDLGSTNHTYLNGEELVVGQDYNLHDGDEVILGRLVMKVFFK